MKRHVLLSILFLFVAAISFSENRPPGNTDKIELSFDQPSAEVIADYVIMYPLVEIGVYFSDAESALVNCLTEETYMSVIGTILEEGSGGDYSISATTLTSDPDGLKRHNALTAYVYDFDYSCNRLLS